MIPSDPSRARDDADGIRLCRIISRLITGGPTRQVRLLARGLEAFGYRTTVVTGTASPGERDETDVFLAEGVTPRVIPGFRREIGVLRDFRALLHLIRLLRAIHPHVVHTHTAKAGFLGRIAAKCAGVPVIVHTFHGHVFHGYFGAFLSRLLIWLERMLSVITDQVIVVSRGLEHELVHKYRIASENKIRVVELGLDLDIAPDAPGGGLHRELGLSADALIVGTAGRLVPVKNHALLLRAFAGLRMPGAHLVLAGDGPLRGALASMADRLAIAARVHFLGWRDDLGSLFRDLSLFVVSSHNEGTPVAAIEAMAMGVPVLSCRVGGMGDLLKDRINGRLLDSHDPEVMTRAMQDMLAQPMHIPREETASHCRRFHIDRLLADLDRLYGELFAKKACCKRNHPPSG